MNDDLFRSRTGRGSRGHLYTMMRPCFLLYGCLFMSKNDSIESHEKKIIFYI